MLEKPIASTRIDSSTNSSAEEIDSSQATVQRSNTMNFLTNSVRVNNVDSSQDDQLKEDAYTGYDMISDDSIHNDSRNEDCKDRIIYSRNQLVDVFRTLVDLDYEPDWITDNQNFPRRLDANGLLYLKQLVSEDFESLIEKYSDKTWHKDVKRKPPTEMMSAANAEAMNVKKMGGTDENESIDPSNNGPNNFRLNLNRPGQENSAVHNKNFSKPYNGNNNGFSNNSNNNFKNNPGLKSNERQPFGNNYRNNELRSRGENLNQNFASFRRFPNRNQNDRFNNYRQDVEPEWFTEGPISQHDTIELKGFEDDDKQNANKNAKQEPSPPHQSHVQQPSPQSQQTHSSSHQQNAQQQQPSQHQPQPFKSNFIPNHHEEAKEDYNMNQFTNLDWQNVGTHHNVDKVTIENQANSSRFARWFNDPHQQQSVINTSGNDEQIEKLFTTARNVNHTSNTHPMPFNHNLSPQHQQQQHQQQQQQQQINVQNDFFGNLMNRHPQQNAIKPQQPHPQLNNRVNQSQQQQKQQQILEASGLMNNQSNNKKTNQQLIDILQKAHINVDSLMVQQNVFKKDNMVRIQAKSAEELEAILFSNNSPPRREIQSIHAQPSHHSHPHQFNPSELFQKMCLNSNNPTNKYDIPETVQQQQHQQPINQQQSQDDNCAINPFVLNLLDAQKQKNIATSNQSMNNAMNYQAINSNLIKNQMNNRSNYMPNVPIFTPTLNQQHVEKREEKVNPFMPTSVIRKIAKEKNSLGGRGMGEANFEAVTGNHLSERSILSGGRPLEQQQLYNTQTKSVPLVNNYPMHQAGLMHQNFALATGNRWNDNNSIQQHSIDSTTPNHTNVEQKKLIHDLLYRASLKPTDQTALINNLTSKNQVQPGNAVNQFVRVTQNEEKNRLFELLKRATITGKKLPGTDSTGNKINDWFELEMQRNNNHLSPIVKENAFTLEDIERN